MRARNVLVDGGERHRKVEHLYVCPQDGHTTPQPDQCSAQKPCWAGRTPMHHTPVTVTTIQFVAVGHASEQVR